MIVGGEFQQAGVEVDGVAAAFENDTLEIVIENRSGRAAPVLEGMDVSQEKVLETLIQKELYP